MRLTDLKIPNFKFPKIRMKGIENIPEVNIDYDKLSKEGNVKKDKKQFKPTEYKTIKEICERIGIKHYLATEFDDKTGKFLRGCFREKKIDFFLEAYPDGQIDDFYTDSMNDKFLFPYSKRVFLVDGNKITQYK